MAHGKKKTSAESDDSRVEACSVAFAKLASDHTVDGSDLMNLVHDQFAEHFTRKKPSSDEDNDRGGER